MIKYEGILLSEIFNNDGIVNTLFMNNINTIDELIKNIDIIDNIRGIGIVTKMNIYSKINEYLSGNIILKRTNVDDNLKNIYLNEMGYSTCIIRACKVYNINTLEDIHYIIDRNLIDNLRLLKPHKDEIIIKYNSIISKRVLIKRIFSDEEMNKISLYKDRNVTEFEEFLPVMQTAFKYARINTIEDLSNVILSDSNIRGIGEKYKSLLIEDIKTILSKLELVEEIHK